MLRDEMAKYEKITGEDASYVPIIKIGAYLDGYNKGIEILDKIKAIVDKWQSDTWTDNLSYECMVKIAELVESQESEVQG